jgi:hypothetical protein
MTSMTAEAEVLKQDERGRVRVPVERREALLDEFENSAASGAKFARLAGIKYATFAGWVLRRRKQRAATDSTSDPGRRTNEPLASVRPVRLFEAVVEGGHGEASGRGPAQGLLLELPGGSRVRVESPVQLGMAAELICLIAQSVRARC